MIRRKAPTTEKGRFGEDTACRFLKEMGFRILARNYRTRFAEIDIVAEKSGELVFVEVRSLKASAGHSPEETVDRKKQRQISRAALAYIQQNGMEDMPARFDVLSVEIRESSPRIRHIPDAFELRE